MEPDHLKALSALAAKLATAKEFNMLKPCPRREGMHTAALYFEGYHDLTLKVMDIIKVCASALYGMEDQLSDKPRASPFTIAEVLGLALELMPVEESQILDECYEVHLQLKSKQEDDSNG